MRPLLIVVFVALGACDRVEVSVEERGCGEGCLPGYVCSQARGVCLRCSPSSDPREICDGRDNDCDGEIDDAADGAAGCTSWFTDADADGAGAGPARCLCDGTSLGLVETSGDLADDDPTRYPGAPELCDGLDNDLNLVVPTDERDDDADGAVECALPPDRALALGLVGGDCDDTLAGISPTLPESCDGIDTNCDGALEPSERDDDGDRYVACDFVALPGAEVMVDGGADCETAAATVYPGAPEIEDGLDNDCDTDVDECLVDCDCGPDVHACYRFEAGSVGSDGSGRGYDATVVAGAPGSMTGVRGTAVVMSVGDLLGVTNLASWPLSAITLEVFIQPASLPVTGSRMAVLDGEGSWNLFVLPGGGLRCGAGATADAPVGTIVAGVWTHVACVNDGAALTLYVDGVEARRELASSLSDPPSEVWIGANAPDEDQRFIGALDELRIWKTARSGAELCGSAGELCAP